MEFKFKTLYLLEELPIGRIQSSLLKTITSRDTMRGRQLHSSMTSVDIIGKLIINSNTPPDLGEEGPVWDRAIYIPWDTRYVHGDEKVDEANYRLPSDNAKKQQIVSLKSAFVTVCLTELTRFLNLPGHMDDSHKITVSELPVPKCVVQLTEQEKERAFPLKMFVKHHMVEKPGHKLDVIKFDQAYRGFLESRHIKYTDSLDDLINKFRRVGLECKMDSVNRNQYISDYRLDASAHEFCESAPILQAFKKQKVSADNNEVF